MNSRSFVSIEKNEVFKGKLPVPLTIPVSEVVGKHLTVSRLVKASPGDKDYEKVLITWMFTHGYILRDKNGADKVAS